MRIRTPRWRHLSGSAAEVHSCQRCGCAPDARCASPLSRAVCGGEAGGGGRPRAQLEISRSTEIPAPHPTPPGSFGGGGRVVPAGGGPGLACGRPRTGRREACPHGACHIKSSSLQTYRSGRRAPRGPTGTGAPRCAGAGVFARRIGTSSRFRTPQPVLHSRPDFQQSETPIQRNPYRTNVLRQPRGTRRSRGTPASGPRSPTPARRPRAAARPR